MSGLDEFRNVMKNYRNAEFIGITMGELVSIEPVKIKVVYGNKDLFFTEFKSLTGFEGVKEEDIGTLYTVQFTGDNQTLFVLGDIKTYKDFYPLK